MTRSAFEAFYGDSKNRCYRALLSVIGNVGDADDLMAEAYTRAWQRWPEVSAHPAPEAWVVRVALNLHSDNWRSRRLWSRLRPAPPTPAPTLGLDVDLLQALRALPERQRDVVVMRILLDQSNEQVAATLAIAPATVSVHLHRGLAALRLTVTPHDDMEAPAMEEEHIS